MAQKPKPDHDALQELRKSHGDKRSSRMGRRIGIHVTPNGGNRRPRRRSSKRR